MHPDVEKLIELERLTTEIRRYNNEIAALPQRVAAIEKKLASTQALVEKIKAGGKQNEQNRRKFEGDIQALQQKISKYRDQSLAVKTNQEYKALLDEVAYAEREIREKEDKILDSMVEAESLDVQLKEAEKLLAAERAEVQKEQNEARSRTAEDEAQLAQLLPQRDALLKQIDESLVRHYERVVRQRGSGVAEVRDSKCTACHVMLRPQVYNEVRTDEKVITCDSCQRVLYYDASRDAAPAEPVPTSTSGQ